jgi:hypothetical protein
VNIRQQAKDTSQGAQKEEADIEEVPFLLK